MGTERLLEAVGVGEFDERVYVGVLEHRRGSLDELCAHLDLPHRRVRASLRLLEGLGLVSFTPERPVRYFAAPPDVAVEALIVRKQEQLQQTRLAVNGLWERVRDATPRGGHGDELVEIVIGRRASVQRFEQMLAAAEDEVLIFDRSPYAEPGEINPVEREALARGIVYRAVYDSLSVDRPGAIDRIRDYVTAGEHARVFSPLPLLAAGLKDEAIARQLGMSARTLDRRLAALMRDLDARTRFQAGWAAALRHHGQSGEVSPASRP